MHHHRTGSVFFRDNLYDPRCLSLSEAYLPHLSLHIFGIRSVFKHFKYPNKKCIGLTAMFNVF